MLDGSDAIADWPLLNAMLNTACGASWVSSTMAAAWASAIDPLRHGGGGRRNRQGDRRLERVLTADPGTGVMRHADAGYQAAVAKDRECRLADGGRVTMAEAAEDHTATGEAAPAQVALDLELWKVCGICI